MTQASTLARDADRQRAGFLRLLWRHNKVGFFAGLILIVLALLAICAPGRRGAGE